MSIESFKRRGLPVAAAVCVACLALVSGCKSSGTSTGSAGQPAGADQSAAGSGATSAAAAAAGSGSFKAACPPVAQVAAALGTSLPSHDQDGDSSGLVCTYDNSATGADIAITITPLAGVGASVLKTVADSAAQAQGVSATTVSGIGQAAYQFTMKDASSNPSGVATTVLIFVDGAEEVDITAQSPVDKVLALAHAILGN